MQGNLCSVDDRKSYFIMLIFKRLATTCYIVLHSPSCYYGLLKKKSGNLVKCLEISGGNQGNVMAKKSGNHVLAQLCFQYIAI